MSNKITIPFLSPVRFVVKSLIVDTGAVRHFDEALFYDQIHSFQEKKIYFQKWQKSDTIAFQLASNLAPTSVKLIDRYENVIKTVVPTVVANSYYSAPDVVYLTSMMLDDVDEGYYWLKITFGDGGGDSSIFLSEPIEILEEHMNTILFNYGNDKNEYGLIFRDGQTFNFRCEAILTDFQPGTNEVVYEDQPANMVRLSSSPYRSFKLILGDAHGVPDWVADKINRILACDTVLFSGKQFVRPEGSKMERNGDRMYPMAGWTIDVREAKARDSQVFENDIASNAAVVVAYDLETQAFGDLLTPPFGGDITIENVE